MSRISTYPIDTVVDTADLLIGTDSEDSNITKNYTIASIISLAESSIDLAEVLAVGNTATNNINLTGIMTATTVNGTNGTIGVFGSTTGNITTVNSTNIVNSALVSTADLTATTGNITTVNSTNIVNSALVSTADLTATTGNITTVNSTNIVNSASVTTLGLTATTGVIATLGSTTGNISTLNSTNIVNAALVSTANLTATAGITNNLLYIDYAGSSGTINQVLLSTGTATAWGNQVTSTWNLDADSGGPLTISDEDGVNFNGGTYITTLAATPISPENKVISIIHDDTARIDTPLTPTALAYGGTFTAISSATTNTTGHVTATDVTTYTLPAAKAYIGARANMAGQYTNLPIITQWYALNYVLADVTASLWTTQLGTAGYNTRVRYEGSPDQTFNITVTFTINGWTVGDIAQFALYNGNAIISKSEQKIEATSSLYTTGTLQAMQFMGTGDFIEVYAKAPTATTIVSVDYLTISVVPV
jgi:hypothetical protein